MLIIKKNLKGERKSEGESEVSGRRVPCHDTSGQECSQKYKEVKKCSQNFDKKQVEMKTREGNV